MRRMLVSALMIRGIASFGQASTDHTANHPLISEIRYYQHSGINEEFVELYNPTSAPIPLKGWKIAYKTKTGSTWRVKVVFGERHSLKPHGFFLWGGTAVVPAPDSAVSDAQDVGFSNTGGNVALRDPADGEADRIGWGGGDAAEGAPVATKNVEGGSLERKAAANSTALSMARGGDDAAAGNGYDTDDNNSDFVVHNHFAETNPQNSGSPTEPEWVVPVGIGTCRVAPGSVAALDSVSLLFRFRPDGISVIRELGIRIPAAWRWTFSPDDVDLEGGCFDRSSVRIAGDTIRVSDVSLAGADSGAITVRRLGVQGSADSATFEVFTSRAGEGLAPIAAPPRLDVRLSPVAIARLHRNDGLGVPAAPFEAGTRVMVTGTVTAGHGTFASSPGTAFLQDGTGGLCLYDASAAAALSTGDSITITGTVGQYRGMTELAPDWPTLIRHGAASAIPAAKVLTCSQACLAFRSDGTEPDEGRLVRLMTVVFDTETRTLSDSTGTATLFVESGSGIAVPAGTFHVTGLLKQYKSGTDIPPYTTDYEIVPRTQSDFEPIFGPQFLTTPEAVETACDRAVIAWTTDREASGEIVYAEEGAACDTAASPARAATDHRIEINGLRPGTVYRYSVRSWNGNGSSRTADRLFITCSDPSSPGVIRPLFNSSVDGSLAGGVFAQGGTDLIDRLVQRIDSAGHSIDMCFMKLGEWDVRDALIEAFRRGVRIRFIVDDEYSDQAEIADLAAAGIPVIDDTFGGNDGAGCMHNKFAVFDHRDGSSFADDRVWTGSFNITYYGGSPPAVENVVDIQDQALAEIYTREFEEMWGGPGDTPDAGRARFGARKTDNVPHSVRIGGVLVEAAMSPGGRVAERVTALIRSADHTAFFCQYSFTADDIALALYRRMQEAPGLDVRGVMDSKQAEDDGSASEWEFVSGFADVLFDGEPGILHSKYLVADAGFPDSDPAVATGSYNWTNKAEYSNDENLLVIHDAEVARQYLQEFAGRYRAAGGTRRFLTGVVSEGGASSPRSLELPPNFPNPFNAGTEIRYILPAAAEVDLSVLDAAGRRVARLDSGRRDRGFHSLRWGGGSETGAALPSGVYVLRLRAGTEVRTRKMLILK
jgi:hypothetical protein